MSKFISPQQCYCIRLFTIITLLFCLLPTFSVLAQLTGKVIAVSDGDTFTLLINDHKQVKVRLFGIDCPEKKQPFGQRAKQFTSDEIFGKHVTVTNKGTDRYGRTIGLVFEPNGECLNEELLKAGLAWHYTQYDKHNIAWRSLESQARSKKAGLWCEKDCIAPWDWRKEQRGKPSKKKAA